LELWQAQVNETVEFQLSAQVNGRIIMFTCIEELTLKERDSHAAPRRNLDRDNFLVIRAEILDRHHCTIAIRQAIIIKGIHEKEAMNFLLTHKDRFT
jgi:hypothetical protein